MEHLTDAPVANILILAGIIFLAVGIFGRVGGFIGSIFGNIEAGKNSRVLAGTLGLLLIVGGGWMHEGNHKSPASNLSPSTPDSGTSPAGTTSPSVAPDVSREVSKAKDPGAEPAQGEQTRASLPGGNQSSNEPASRIDWHAFPGALRMPLEGDSRVSL
jgi:hypothetical protein